MDNLLKAVEATNIFEVEMARRFEGAAEPLDDQVRSWGGPSCSCGYGLGCPGSGSHIDC